MKFSNSVEYAIHGLIILARASLPATVLIADIAKKISVPEAYLRKVFQQLTKAGLVTSFRGAHGGYSLARSPKEISLKDIVEAIDGSLPSYHCLRSQRHCRLDKACPVDEAFEAARAAMGKVLQATTLQTVLTAIAGRADTIDWLKLPVLMSHKL